MTTVQKQILEIMYEWVHTQKTPIKLKDLVQKLPNVKERTVRTSADALCQKGHLRRGINIKHNCCYILLRTKPYEEAEY